jgi:hypothetical protein
MSSGRLSIVGVLSLAVVGCGGGSKGPSDPAEAEHLRHVGGLVAQYTNATKKQPAKIDEVRDWAVKAGKAAADDFASTRDKQLYTIAFTGTGLVVHEQSGESGKCYLLSMGGVTQVPTEEARRLVQAQRLGPGARGPNTNPRR